MPLNTRSKISSFALKTLAGAVASAVFLSSSAYAAGLGKLTVLSSLGQPLNAEIELTAVANDEVGGLVAKLASAEAFRQANIDFNPTLLSLRFLVEQRGSRQFVKITSSLPLNEPFVDMLLELSWGNNGRLVREYTFLLDPAELRATQSAQVAAPVDVLNNRQAAGAKGAAPAAAGTANATNTAKPAERAAEAPRATEKTEGASEYRTKAGDTLGKIAAKLRPVDISLDMMLVALYRANPDAFAGNNMNRLKSGQILSVPDSSAIKGTGEGEARGVVVAHAADFNAYRNKLAGQVSTAAPDKAPETGRNAGGKITAKVEERATAANEAKDQLKLSKAGANAGKGAEERIAKDKALAEANARVKELERNVSELEKLMTIKNKAATEAAQKAAAKPAPMPAPVAAPVPAPAPVAAKPAPVPVPAPIPAPVAAKPVPAPVAAPMPAPVAAPVAAAASAPSAAAVVAPTPAAPAPKPVVKKAPAPAPVAEPSFVDMIMDNIVYVAAGLGALLLGLFGIVAMRRRNPNLANPNEPSILGAPTDQAHSLFAETGGQSVDTNNSVFNSSFAPSASQLDTNEVDPVAEADVYIAYGRDAQAEEILKEALRTHPERYPVRLKLLEIYAARKDLRSFENQASELYGMTKGQGDEWAQAAALGMSIDALNPLYANAGAGGPTTIAPSSNDAGQQTILNQQLDDAMAADGPHSALMDLDLDLSADSTAVPAAAPAAKADEHTLDFDLGGLSFDAPDTVAGPAVDPHDLAFNNPVAAPAKAEEQEDMAFDLGFDTPVATAPATREHTQVLDEISIDNDMKADFGTVDLSKEFNKPSEDLHSLNFDVPSTAKVGDQPDAQNFFDVPDLPLRDEAAAPQFDMSGLDLDLPGDKPEFADVGRVDALAPAANSAAHMEMETKLDLAIAYQEIGDKEGARELLDEVIKGGSSDQVSKANEMRAKLA